jgi:hypothetical protein
MVREIEEKDTNIAAENASTLRVEGSLAFVLFL